MCGLCNLLNNRSGCGCGNNNGCGCGGNNNDILDELLANRALEIIAERRGCGCTMFENLNNLCGCGNGCGCSGI